MKLSKNSDSKIKAVAFTRIKAKQIGDTRGYMRAQKLEISESAQELGFEIVKWFDQVGGTTQKEKNETLIALAEYAKKEGIKRVLITSLSRISRSRNEAFWWIDYLQKNGVNIIASKAGVFRDSPSKESAEVILLKLLFDLLASYKVLTKEQMIERLTLLNKQLD